MHGDESVPCDNPTPSEKTMILWTGLGIKKNTWWGWKNECTGAMETFCYMTPCPTLLKSSNANMNRK